MEKLYSINKGSYLLRKQLIIFEKNTWKAGSRKLVTRNTLAIRIIRGCGRAIKD